MDEFLLEEQAILKVLNNIRYRVQLHKQPDCARCGAMYSKRREKECLRCEEERKKDKEKLIYWENRLLELRNKKELS